MLEGKKTQKIRFQVVGKFTKSETVSGSF